MYSPVTMILQCGVTFLTFFILWSPPECRLPTKNQSTEPDRSLILVKIPLILTDICALLLHIYKFYSYDKVEISKYHTTWWDIIKRVMYQNNILVEKKQTWIFLLLNFSSFCPPSSFSFLPTNVFVFLLCWTISDEERHRSHLPEKSEFLLL